MNSEPGTGTGRARPLSSGAPSSMRMQVSRRAPPSRRVPAGPAPPGSRAARLRPRRPPPRTSGRASRGGCGGTGPSPLARPAGPPCGRHPWRCCRRPGPGPRCRSRRSLPPATSGQEIDRRQRQFLAGAVQSARTLRADGEKDRIEVAAQVVEGEIAAQPRCASGTRRPGSG